MFSRRVRDAVFLNIFLLARLLSDFLRRMLLLLWLFWTDFLSVVTVNNK